VSLLELDAVTLRFGGLTAVEDVSFAVNAGDVFGLLGPNGAGKSTLFNLISRFYTPASGDIRVDGSSVLGLSPSEIPSLGVARTFQNIELFERATVIDNLLIGRNRHVGTGLVSNLLFTPFTRAEERRHREAVERVIDFLELQAYRDKHVGGLPYGVRKVVELGRALAMEPRLLLLDEPASGLSVEESIDLAFWIEDIRDQMGITVLLVEHDMKLVSSVCNRVLALADGRQLAIGTPAEVQSDPAVVRAYLGDGEIAA
jgi:branched-chain amino acid transport system ATP-binding protein